MDRDIMSHETRLAFARVGAKVMGGGFGLHYFFLREEMSAAGIGTTEILETTWAGRQTESLKTVDRFQGYYDTIDWRNRDDVRRMFQFLRKSSRLFWIIMNVSLSTTLLIILKETD